MRRIVIVGAGIAGLSTAYYLTKKARGEIEIILLEKEGRVGGTLLTEQINGFLLEGGPDCFISEKPWALRLCQELGIEGDVIGTNREVHRTFVLWEGVLHEIPEGFILLAPTSLWPFLRSPLFSIGGKLRMGMDLFLPRRRQKGDESLASFVRRRLGKEALERIAEPLVAGIHAGAPETMSLLSTFPRFLELEQVHRSIILGMYRRKKQSPTSAGQYTPFLTLRQGMQGLAEALQRVIRRGAIYLQQEVLRVERAKGKAGYLLQMRGEKEISADAVVLATPAYITAQLLRGLADEISPTLASIPYTSTATVNLAYERFQISHPLDGYGFVVPRRQKRRIMAATFSSVKFSGRAPAGKVLLRAFVGGAKDEGICSLEDRELLSAVRHDIEEILKIKGEPLLCRIYRWPRSMPQYTLGHQERISRIEEAIASHPGLFLTGSSYRGIGISDCVHQGALAAEKVLDYLQINKGEGVSDG